MSRGMPTDYAGVTFRSLLEAEWAHRFDQIGVRWVYEGVRVRLPQGWYLVDFVLPGLGLYAEVKPGVPSAAEFSKAAAAYPTIGAVWFFCGHPDNARYWAAKYSGGTVGYELANSPLPPVRKPCGNRAVVAGMRVSA